MTLIMDAPTTERFTRICKIASLRTRGAGLTLQEIGDAAALARAVEASESPERVERLAARLGLEPEEVQ